MHHLVSQTVQLANVGIEAAILNVIQGVLVLTSTPSTSSSWFAYTKTCREWSFNSPKK